MRHKPEITLDKSDNFKPKSRQQKQLVKAISSLQNEEDTAKFLKDLLTQTELDEFANRLEIAKLLLQRKLSYIEIADKVGTSTTTVTRVAQWVFKGTGGYIDAIEKLK